MAKQTIRPGIIRRGAVYTRAEFIARLGMCEATFRKLKRDGLKVAQIGQYQFISGESWFEFVRERER